jgi:hypothetical protein
MCYSYLVENGPSRQLRADVKAGTLTTDQVDPSLGKPTEGRKGRRDQINPRVVLSDFVFVPS